MEHALHLRVLGKFRCPHTTPFAWRLQVQPFLTAHHLRTSAAGHVFAPQSCLDSSLRVVRLATDQALDRVFLLLRQADRFHGLVEPTTQPVVLQVRRDERRLDALLAVAHGLEHLPGLQVLHEAQEDVLVISRMTQREVAAVAEEPTNLTGLVIVIDA